MSYFIGRVLLILPYPIGGCVADSNIGSPKHGWYIHIPPEGKTLDEITREAVIITLKFTKDNRTAAAKMLGISRPTIGKIIATHYKLDQYKPKRKDIPEKE
jgi:DNA-binding NtrC family response regulator